MPTAQPAPAARPNRQLNIDVVTIIVAILAGLLAVVPAWFMDQARDHADVQGRWSGIDTDLRDAVAICELRALDHARNARMLVSGHAYYIAFDRFNTEGLFSALSDPRFANAVSSDLDYKGVVDQLRSTYLILNTDNVEMDQILAAEANPAQIEQGKSRAITLLTFLAGSEDQCQHSTLASIKSTLELKVSSEITTEFQASQWNEYIARISFGLIVAALVVFFVVALRRRIPVTNESASVANQ